MDEKIRMLAQRAFVQLGSGHSEYVYHRALELEFRCHGFRYEAEKHLPVVYVDSCGHRNTIADARIDFVLRLDDKAILVELKAVNAKPRPQDLAQLRKYARLLLPESVAQGLLINFPQAGTKPARAEIDFERVSLHDP